MNRDEIQSKLKEAVLAETRIFLPRGLGAVTDSDRLREDVGLDSVGLLYLVLAIEETFNLEIDDAEGLAERFATWGELVNYVSEHTL